MVPTMSLGLSSVYVALFKIEHSLGWDIYTYVQDTLIEADSLLKTREEFELCGDRFN